jgi:hypothetical protein
MTQSQQFTKIQYGPEASAYGTEASAYNELARVQSVSIDPTNNLIYSRGLGEGLNVTNAYYGQYAATGSVSFDVVSFAFLRHFVGDQTGAGNSGDKYTLTEGTTISAEAETATVIQPFSIEAFNDDTTDQSTVGIGCVGQSFTLQGSIGSALTCDATFVCQKTYERESGATYVPVTTSAFQMLNGTWKFDATPTALVGVRAFSISMDNGLVTDTYSIESRFMTIPKLGGPGRTYNWSLTIMMAQALGDQIIDKFYGKESPTNTYIPEDGATSVKPDADMEFSVDLVNGASYATLALDHITFNGTAFTGKGNTPIKWWTV